MKYVKHKTCDTEVTLKRVSRPLIDGEQHIWCPTCERAVTDVKELTPRGPYTIVSQDEGNQK